jgi:hypothetical protein
MSLVIVGQLGMIILGAQFDNVATVWPFEAMVVRVRIGGGAGRRSGLPTATPVEADEATRYYSNRDGK